ncbi:MAG: DNA-processing protein DprA, partial [Planctomycetes bacterium]|nr:DNA-processing protein DprA [Planctomycetota bacterium]
MLATVEGCGPGIQPTLLSPDLDPACVLDGRVEGLPRRVRARLNDRARLESDAARALDAADRLGFAVVTPTDAHYPPVLRGAPCRPVVLFARGDLSLLESSHRALAIVGSRTPTAYGLAATEDFTAAIARTGTAIWSGLATGVDATAHRACL